MENELLTVQHKSVAQELSQENTRDEVVSTINFDTPEGKKALYNAMNGSESSLRDMVGKKLKIVDVVAHKVQLTNEQTGEIQNTIRVVFIDDKGHSYATVSTGVVSSIKKLISVFGYPDIANPWTISPRMAKGRKFNYLTIDIV